MLDPQRVRTEGEIDAQKVKYNFQQKYAPTEMTKHLKNEYNEATMAAHRRYNARKLRCVDVRFQKQKTILLSPIQMGVSLLDPNLGPASGVQQNLTEIFTSNISNQGIFFKK